MSLIKERLYKIRNEPNVLKRYSVEDLSAGLSKTAKSIGSDCRTVKSFIHTNKKNHEFRT